VFLFLFCVFVVFPLIELGVVIAVAGWIGIVPTIAALIAMSAIGVWLVKREGLGVVRRTREAMNRGEVPGGEMLDAAMLTIAGFLCFVPGFISGTIGPTPGRSSHCASVDACRFVRRHVSPP